MVVVVQAVAELVEQLEAEVLEELASLPQVPSSQPTRVGLREVTKANLSTRPKHANMVQDQQAIIKMLQEIL